MRYEYWIQAFSCDPEKVHNDPAGSFGQTPPRIGESVSLDTKTYVVKNVIHYPKSSLVRIFIERDVNELARIADEENKKKQETKPESVRNTKEKVEDELERQKGQRKQGLHVNDDDWGDY